MPRKCVFLNVLLQTTVLIRPGIASQTAQVLILLKIQQECVLLQQDADNFFPSQIVSSGFVWLSVRLPQFSLTHRISPILVWYPKTVLHQCSLRISLSRVCTTALITQPSFHILIPTKQIDVLQSVLIYILVITQLAMANAYLFVQDWTSSETIPLKFVYSHAQRVTLASVLLIPMVIIPPTCVFQNAHLRISPKLRLIEHVSRDVWMEHGVTKLRECVLQNH